jgi:hypothetical protein
MLKTKLIERAAEILYQSFNTVSVADAWCMTLGEVEAEFNTDFVIELTPAIEMKILSVSNSL